MNYKQIHDSIISQAQERATSKKEANLVLGYSEAHHILPKCMGGTNDKANIVHLSAREHFVIHQLLVKIYPLEPKLLYACFRLLYDKKGNRTNGKKYEALKKKINVYKKSLNKHNSESVRIVTEKRTGRTKETCPGVKSAADAQRGRSASDYEYLAIRAENQNKISKELRNIVVELWSNGVPPVDIVRKLNLDITTATILNICQKQLSQTYSIIKEERRKNVTRYSSTKNLSNEIKDWIVELVECKRFSWKQILIMLRLAGYEMKIAIVKSTYLKEANLNTFIGKIPVDDISSTGK